MAHNQKQPKKLHKAHFHSLAGPPTDITNTHMHTHSVTPTFPHTRHPPPHTNAHNTTHISHRDVPWGPGGVVCPDHRRGAAGRPVDGGVPLFPLHANLCGPGGPGRCPHHLVCVLQSTMKRLPGLGARRGSRLLGVVSPPPGVGQTAGGAPPRSRKSRNSKLFFFESF